MTGKHRAAAGAGLAVVALTLSACGGSAEQTQSTTEPGPSPTVTLHAATHHPSVRKPWPIVIRAYDRAGRPLSAEVRYQYLFGGAVVAHRSRYRFRGTFHDSFHWPARAIGIPLTFRAVVTTPLGARKLDYDVKVRR